MSSPGLVTKPEVFILQLQGISINTFDPGNFMYPIINGGDTSEGYKIMNPRTSADVKLENVVLSFCSEMQVLQPRHIEQDICQGKSSCL